MTAPANPRVPIAPDAPGAPPAPAPAPPRTPSTPPPGVPLVPPGEPVAPPDLPIRLPPPHPPAHPPALLATEEATDLLDRVVYEQVIECIDLDELFRVEQSLAFTASSLPGVSHARSTELAKALLDRAFRRLPDDIRTYLRAVEAMACNGCDLCEEEAREAQAARSSPSSRRGARFRS